MQTIAAFHEILVQGLSKTVIEAASIQLKVIKILRRRVSEEAERFRVG